MDVTSKTFLFLMRAILFRYDLKARTASSFRLLYLLRTISILMLTPCSLDESTLEEVKHHNENEKMDIKWMKRMMI